MKPLAVVGVLLIVLGLVGLTVQGFSYVTREKAVDIGPIEITKEEEKHVPVPPILGLASVAAGIALVALGKKGG